LDIVINSLASAHLSSTQNEELLSMHKSLREDLAERLNALPETLHAAVSVLQTAHAEFAVSRDASKRDQEEIRKLKAANAELQVQVAKARGAHGQVRVEKDNLAERLKDVESERDRLRSQVEELHNTIRTQSANTAAVESRNSELEAALSQSLARLKTSDVVTQTNQERISELEKANKEALVEQANLNSKVRCSIMTSFFV
jgi:chromosome segregation ATPase